MEPGCTVGAKGIATGLPAGEGSKVYADKCGNGARSLANLEDPLGHFESMP